MSDGEPVKTARDFRERLERSDILRSDELQTSQWMSQEASSAKMLARRLVAKGILTRWQAGQLLRGRERLRFGNYKLCEQIGRGASGRVFLAEHIQLHREVAIKILSRHLTQERRIVDRFLEDARQAAKLNHHNLAHVLDMDNAQGQYYLVMEYVAGQDLQELVKASGHLAPAEVLDYLCQAADGLHHAHQAGAVHGDLCPANLMRDEHGVIKVVGWGVGRGVRRLTDQEPLADQPPDSTATHTPAPDDRHVYWAPEQRRDNGVGSVSGDIHALGQTAGYLLTGQLPAPPGTGSSGDPLTRGALGFDWNRAGAQVPTWLIKIIERMTAVEPEERFETAQAVCGAVQSQRDESPEQSLTGPVPRVDRSESLPISDEANEGAEVPVVSLVRTSRAGSDSGEQPLRFRFGPRGVVGIVAAMALASLLVTAVVYSFGPDHSGSAGAAKGSRTAVQESGARRSRPAIKPRRREASSSALETSWLDSGAADGGVKKKEEESAGDAPRDEDLEEPDRAHATPKETPAESGKEKASESGAKEPRSSTSDEPTGKASESDASETKNQSTLESSSSENPFRQFPSAIDLPALDASGAKRGELDIASLAVPARETTVSLLGGAGASRGPGRFILKTDDRQTPPTWRVLFCGDEQDSDEQDSEDGLEIATFQVQDKQLRFSWEAAASQCAVAARLGNCVLRFSLQE
ncbi:MAG: serine/threonine protein kinase, partial [Planctomycetota bacterium]